MLRKIKFDFKKLKNLNLLLLIPITNNCKLNKGILYLDKFIYFYSWHTYSPKCEYKYFPPN